MKVIHIITGLSTGGAERALYNLLSGGLAECFDNCIVSLSDEGTLGAKMQELGVQVITLDMPRGRLSLAGLRKLYKLVREFQPDVVQGWMYHGNLAAMVARWFSPCHPRLLWNIRHSLYELNHEKKMTQYIIRASKLFSNFPDMILYNSQLSREQHEFFGFSSNNGRVIPNGINVRNFFFSHVARRGVRSELGIPAVAQVVGHVARLHPMKDHPLFLRVAVRLAQKHPLIHFLLSGKDVTLDNKYIEQMVPVSVRDRFHLLGERADVHELMCAMDVFCQSSWSEAFPNVLGEAMATAVPCVATDVGDSGIIVGDTGCVVPCRDERELAAGIEHLLVMPIKERCLLGEKARARIESRYTLDAIVGKYSVLYKKMISVKGAN